MEKTRVTPEFEEVFHEHQLFITQIMFETHETQEHQYPGGLYV